RTLPSESGPIDGPSRTYPPYPHTPYERSPAPLLTFIPFQMSDMTSSTERSHTPSPHATGPPTSQSGSSFQFSHPNIPPPWLHDAVEIPVPGHSTSSTSAASPSPSQYPTDYPYGS